jgi:hypothetical protein
VLIVVVLLSLREVKVEVICTTCPVLLVDYRRGVVILPEKVFLLRSWLRILDGFDCLGEGIILVWSLLLLWLEKTRENIDSGRDTNVLCWLLRLRSCKAA